LQRYYIKLAGVAAGAAKAEDLAAANQFEYKDKWKIVFTVLDSECYLPFSASASSTSVK